MIWGFLVSLLSCEIEESEGGGGGFAYFSAGVLLFSNLDVCVLPVTHHQQTARRNNGPTPIPPSDSFPNLDFSSLFFLAGMFFADRERFSAIRLVGLGLIIGIWSTVGRVVGECWYRGPA